MSRFPNFDFANVCHDSGLRRENKSTHFLRHRRRLPLPLFECQAYLALTVGFVATVGLVAAGSRRRENRVRLVLHARLGRIQIERAVLDVGVDAAGGVEKRLLDALARLGGRLEKHEPVLVGELLRLLVGHVALRLQI